VFKGVQNAVCTRPPPVLYRSFVF